MSHGIRMADYYTVEYNFLYAHFMTYLFNVFVFNLFLRKF